MTIQSRRLSRAAALDYEPLDKSNPPRSSPHRPDPALAIPTWRRASIRKRKEEVRTQASDTDRSINALLSPTTTIPSDAAADVGSRRTSAILEAYQRSSMEDALAQLLANAAESSDRRRRVALLEDLVRGLTPGEARPAAAAPRMETPAERRGTELGRSTSALDTGQSGEADVVAEWISQELWVFCTSRSEYSSTPPAAAARIASTLKRSQRHRAVPPPILLLSLYFASLLPVKINDTKVYMPETPEDRFRSELFGNRHRSGRREKETGAPHKLFTLGVLLACGVVKDPLFTASSWRRTADLPPTSRNRLEQAAVQVIGEGISPSSSICRGWFNQCKARVAEENHEFPGLILAVINSALNSLPPDQPSTTEDDEDDYELDGGALAAWLADVANAAPDPLPVHQLEPESVAQVTVEAEEDTTSSEDVLLDLIDGVLAPPPEPSRPSTPAQRRLEAMHFLQQYVQGKPNQLKRTDAVAVADAKKKWWREGDCSSAASYGNARTGFTGVYLTVMRYLPAENNEGEMVRLWRECFTPRITASPRPIRRWCSEWAQVADWEAQLQDGAQV